MRSGFVALSGRSNAGKSTLINALLKEKIAIVSEKRQTTRSEIRGILTNEEGQIVFVDTPGFSRAQIRLEVQMNKTAEDVMRGVDLIYLVVDGSVPYGKEDEKILNMAKDTGLPVFLILNKTDRMSRDKIVEVLTSYASRYSFAEFFPISAKEDNDFNELIHTTMNYLPEGEYLYPEEMTSDGSENFRIAEIIREKVLQVTMDELPHACAVSIENKEFHKGSCTIQALILVERQSQKPIIIGKGGERIKEIGMRARPEIEALLGKKVFLSLYVRVESDWRKLDHKIFALGYGEGDE